MGMGGDGAFFNAARGLLGGTPMMEDRLKQK
jgi:hypothetical protein